MIAIILVLSSGLIHATWNLFTKRSIDKTVFLWLCQWAAVIIFLPWAIISVYHRSISGFGIALMVVSAAIHGLYVVLLAKTYTVGDLSHVYPIMRGTSPILVPLGGAILLSEQLNHVQWTGVVLVVCGIALLGILTRISGRQRPTAASALDHGIDDSLARSATALAIGVGLSIAAYTLVDKWTLQEVPAIVLNDASNIGNVLALSWWAIRSKGIQREWKAHWPTILLGGLLAPGGYLLFLLAIEYAPVSQMAPMREVSTVFGTLYGIWILRERQGVQRVSAAALITIGVILLSIT